MTSTRRTAARIALAVALAANGGYVLQACSSTDDASTRFDAGFADDAAANDAIPAAEASNDASDGTADVLDGGPEGEAHDGDASEAGTGPFDVSVTVTGLKGTGLVLQNNGADDLSVNPNDGGTQTVTFSTKIALGKGYAVTVKTQPTSPKQWCTVSGGTGAAIGVPIEGITVSCATAEDATYFGACMTALAPGELDKVLRFYVEMSTLPTGASTKLLDWKMTALALGPDSGAPTSFVKSGTVGTTTTISNTPVDAAGKFTINAGTIAIPAAANPIIANNMVIESTQLKATFATPSFCSQLSGNVTQPFAFELQGSQNTCVFIRTNEGDAVPAITGQMFANGCPQ